MTRLEIHLDAETLQPIIQVAVDAAVHRLQAERATTEPDKILVDKSGGPIRMTSPGAASEQQTPQARGDAGRGFFYQVVTLYGSRNDEARD
jgi:hypothetical protein